MNLEGKRQDVVATSEIQKGERYRKDFGDLEDLATDIALNGLINAIAIMELPEGGYLLLAGERRLRAYEMLSLAADGYNHIPCTIYPYIESELDRRTIELAENLKRKDMSYAEEVELKLQIHELQIELHGVKHGSSKIGHSINDSANILGESAMNLRRDLELARAIRIAPELANAKNKSEASKQLAKAKEELLNEEMARRAKEKTAITEEDKFKKVIMNSFFICDTFVGLGKLETSSIDFLEVDPPYNIALRKVVNTTEKEDEALMGGNKPLSLEEYGVFMNKLLRECHRVLRPNGWIIMWHATDPWHQPIYEWMRGQEFEGSAVPALWVKNNGNTRTPDIHLKNLYEPFFYMRKGMAMLAKPGAYNVFQHKAIAGANKVHPTEKPIELYQEILSVFCRPHHTICSAFAGSGNVLLAAANLDMKAVGFDLNESYRNSFIAKVERGIPGAYTSL